MLASPTQGKLLELVQGEEPSVVTSIELVDIARVVVEQHTCAVLTVGEGNVFGVAVVLNRAQPNVTVVH